MPDQSEKLHQSKRLRDRLRLIGLNVLFVAMYYGAARLGFLFSITQGNVSLIWIPSGLAVAALFVFGPSLVPGLILAIILKSIGPDDSIGGMALSAAGAVFQVFLAVYLMRRLRVHSAFSRIRDVFLFCFLVTVLPSAVAGILGTAALFLDSLIRADEFLQVFIHWSVGDTIGILVAGSLLLTHFNRDLKPAPGRRRQNLSAVPIIVFIGTLGWLGFRFYGQSSMVPLAVTVPLTILLALFFSPRQITAGVSALALGAVAGLKTVSPQLTGDILNEATWMIITILFVSELTMLTISAVLSERDNAEKERLRSEHRYQELIERSDILVTIVDQDGLLVYVNDWSRDVWGLTPEECVGLSAFDFIHPDDKEATEQAFAGWLRDGSSYATFINRQVHVDGRIQDTLWAINLVYNNDGSLLRVNSFGRDISSMKRAEVLLRQHEQELTLEVARKTAELRRSNQILQDAQDLARIGTIIMRSDDGEIAISQEIGQMLGLPADVDTLGVEEFLQHIHPADRTSVAGVMDRIITGETTDTTYRMVTVQGLTRYVHSLSRSLAEVDGRETYIGTLQDVTDMHIMQQAMMESEKRYRNLFDHAGDALFVHDDTGFVDVNGAACEQLGYSREELLTMGPADIVAPENRADVPRLLAEVNQDGFVEFEIMQIRRDGTRYPVWIVSRLIDFVSEKAILSTSRDISVRKELEARLRELATTDPLTGCRNRRSFSDRLMEELDRAQRFGSPFSLISLDLDHFKSINDTYGHDVGDDVLKDVVQALSDELRDPDFLGRMGGEEFGIGLVEIEGERADDVAERLRRCLETRTVCCKDVDVRYTASFGVTDYTGTADSMESMMKRADEALYRAKNAGRNVVCRG